MSGADLVLAFVIVFLGAAIQGAVGFGINLFAAPLLVLLDARFVPAPMIIAALILNLLVARREVGEHHWEGVRRPLVGMVPGSVAGAAVLAVLGSRPDTLAIVFSLLILAAVGISASGLHPKPTPPVLTGAGFASGFMGTAVGIGGPPIALVFQDKSGPDLRGAMARFFSIGSIVSLVLLAAVGRLGVDDAKVGLMLLPGTYVGFKASTILAGRVDVIADGLGQFP